MIQVLGEEMQRLLRIASNLEEGDLELLRNIADEPQTLEADAKHHLLLSSLELVEFNPAEGGKWQITVGGKHVLLLIDMLNILETHIIPLVR